MSGGNLLSGALGNGVGNLLHLGAGDQKGNVQHVVTEGLYMKVSIVTLFKWEGYLRSKQ